MPSPALPTPRGPALWAPSLCQVPPIAPPLACPRGRWLDLFAGTGAIGIEALSRGCGQCHFVELSPWVVSKCLLPNLESCEVDDAAVVHTTVGG